MDFTRESLINKLGITDENILSLICDYRVRFGFLHDENMKGMCVKGSELHKALTPEDGKITEFKDWIRRRLGNKVWEEGVDYSWEWISKNGDSYDLYLLGFIDEYGDTVNWENEDKMATTLENSTRSNLSVSKLDPKNIKLMARYSWHREYYFTADMAKELCMMENNAIGKLTRRYFIEMEKITIQMLEWEKVREPMKYEYNILMDTLERYYKRSDKIITTVEKQKEANLLNIIAFNKTAKEIRKERSNDTKPTRDCLTKEENEILKRLQDLDIKYLNLNMDFSERSKNLRMAMKVLFPETNF